ncbi:VWA domain-containing protein [Breoghania sp.]|uniref:VWA domain-containing protein n=1 Tax=Breoghania sp. TaxID=2065378 RepID=UPI002AA63028|nr:VWA domain-containing protein [Breoghania sp.]
MAQDKTPTQRPQETAPDKVSGRTAETTAPSSRGEIDAFLQKTRELSAAKPVQTGRGRLVFALDATMSRQPTWDTACAIQGDMFATTAAIGGLDVQLVYFRGMGECRASKWAGDANRLGALMSGISCRGGHTQISKVLNHTLNETRKRKVQALVYVGDCMEEKADDLCALAGELGMLGVPAFVFQEGAEPVAEATFREIARLTNGAFCRFSSSSAKELRDLLSAVAAYAAGGREALEDMSRRGGAGARLLIGQMR